MVKECLFINCINSSSTSSVNSFLSPSIVMAVMLDVTSEGRVVMEKSWPGNPERTNRSGPAKSTSGIPGRIVLGPAPVFAPVGFSVETPFG